MQFSRLAIFVAVYWSSFVATLFQSAPPNKLLQRTVFVFTPFASAKAAPTHPAAELRRWAANQMNRVVRDALLSALAISLSSIGYARELMPDEAIVLIRYQNQPMVLGYQHESRPIDSTAGFLIFESLDSNKPIKVRSNRKLQQFIVTAGYYYLKKIDSGSSDLLVPDSSKPKDKLSAIEIPAGSVVYLGDHGFNARFEFHISFLTSSLQEAREMELPKNLPLYASRTGQHPHRIKLK